MEAVKITKVGAEPKILIPKLESKKPKTIRSFPKGILKPVRNPSKQPPIKRGKTTVRIRFESNKKHPKLTRKQKNRKLKELRIGENLPDNLKDEVLKAAIQAGLISR
jgi:hypothetical protein